MSSPTPATPAAHPTPSIETVLNDLLAALREGSVDVIRRQIAVGLSAGLPVHAHRTSLGVPLLFAAVQIAPNVASFEAVLSTDPDPRRRDDDCSTVAHMIALHGSDAMATVMVSFFGSDMWWAVADNDDAETPLDVAARANLPVARVFKTACISALPSAAGGPPKDLPPLPGKKKKRKPGADGDDDDDRDSDVDGLGGIEETKSDGPSQVAESDWQKKMQAMRSGVDGPRAQAEMEAEMRRLEALREGLREREEAEVDAKEEERVAEAEEEEEEARRAAQAAAEAEARRLALAQAAAAVSDLSDLGRPAAATLDLDRIRRRSAGGSDAFDFGLGLFDDSPSPSSAPEAPCAPEQKLDDGAFGLGLFDDSPSPSSAPGAPSAPEQQLDDRAESDDAVESGSDLPFGGGFFGDDSCSDSSSSSSDRSGLGFGLFDSPEHKRVIPQAPAPAPSSGGGVIEAKGEPPSVAKSDRIVHQAPRTKPSVDEVVMDFEAAIRALSVALARVLPPAAKARPRRDPQAGTPATPTSHKLGVLRLAVTALFVFLTLYVGMFTVLGLPCLLMMLVLRHRRVETLVTQFVVRQRVGRAEPRAKTIRRSVTVVLRGLVLAALLVVWPLVWSLVIAPSGSRTATSLCIASTIVIIVSVQVFGTWRAVVSYRHKASRYRIDNHAVFTLSGPDELTHALHDIAAARIQRAWRVRRDTAAAAAAAAAADGGGGGGGAPSLLLHPPPPTPNPRDFKRWFATAPRTAFSDRLLAAQRRAARALPTPSSPLPVDVVKALCGATSAVEVYSVTTRLRRLDGPAETSRRVLHCAWRTHLAVCAGEHAVDVFARAQPLPAAPTDSVAVVAASPASTRSAYAVAAKTVADLRYATMASWSVGVLLCRSSWNVFEFVMLVYEFLQQTALPLLESRDVGDGDDPFDFPADVVAAMGGDSTTAADSDGDDNDPAALQAIRSVVDWLYFAAETVSKDSLVLYWLAVAAVGGLVVMCAALTMWELRAYGLHLLQLRRVESSSATQHGSNRYRRRGSRSSDGSSWWTSSSSDSDGENDGENDADNDAPAPVVDRPALTAKTSREAKFFYSFTGSLVYGHGEPRTVGSVLVVVTLLADALFLPITLQLLNGLTCLYDHPYGDDPLLLASSTRPVVCWDGDHLAVGAACAVALSLYVPLSTLIAPMLMENTLEASLNGEVFASALFDQIVKVVETVLLASWVFWHDSTAANTVPVLLGSVVLLGFTIHWIVRHPVASARFGEPPVAQPYSHPFFSVIKAASFASGVWVALCVAMLDTGGLGWVAANALPWVVLPGVVAVVAGAGLVYRLRWRRNSVSHRKVVPAAVVKKKTDNPRVVVVEE